MQASSTPEPSTVTSMPDRPSTLPSAPEAVVVPPLPQEIGGRDGPEPTRFGDWEKGGRCIDF
jgi:hypothetical protein